MDWAIPKRTLVSIKKGETGVPVWALQRLLNSLPWSKLVEDGDFGPATDAAVRRYQSTRALRPDGVAGPQTQTRMAASVIKLADPDSVLPAGLAKSIVEGESANYCAAVNWNSLGGVDCFAGNQEYLTDEGVKSFVRTVGTTQNVLTDEGFWPAEIKAFGIRDTVAITFRRAYPELHPRDGSTNWNVGRSSHRHSVIATPTHDWLLQNGSTTSTLKRGDLVRGNLCEPERGEQYLDGFRHGLVFGDGSHTKEQGNGRHVHAVQLYGSRSKEALAAGVFKGMKLRRDRSCERESYHGTVAVLADRNLKQVPEDVESDYLAGFVDGWLAADGDHRPSGSWRLRSISHDALEWLEGIAPLAGYVVTGKGEESNTRTNYGLRTRKMRWLCLSSDVGAWRVESVERLGLLPTYCAVVPGKDAFTLAHGIYTHNCGYTQRRVYDPPTDIGVRRAFDSKYQLNLLRTRLVDLSATYRTRPAVRTIERAWRLATLAHNWPAGADRLSRTEEADLDPYWKTPQQWVVAIGAHFYDGHVVQTPLEWCRFYSLGSPAHREIGRMTKYVRIWA